MLKKNKKYIQDEKINTGLKLLVKSSIVIFVGIFLSKLFTYLYRILIARYFGPEVYGIFSLALIVLGFFIAFSLLGLTEGILRFTSLYRGKKQFNKIKYLFSISLIFLFFSSVFFAVLLFILSEFIAINIFHNEDIIVFLKIFSILIPISVFSNLFLSILRAFERVGWYSFIWNILQNLTKLLVLIILIIFGFKINAIIFSYFLSILVVLIASYLFCKYNLSEIFGKSTLRKKEKRKIKMEVFSYSWPIMFSGLIVNLFYWTDSFFLGYFKGAIDVGLYNAAIPLVGLMSFAPVIFTQLFFPLITKEFSMKNYWVINQLSKQVGKWIFILNLPLFLIIILFPGAIINLFFGENYLAAEGALRILVIGGFISSWVFISNDLISMVGKSKVILTNLLLASIVNIVLNILLIPKYGMIGAAVSTTIVWVILSFTLLIELKYYVSIIPLRRKMLRVFFISMIPLAFLLIAKQFVVINMFSLILLGIFFVFIYFLLILLTGCLDREDIMILEALKKKIIDRKTYYFTDTSA